MIVTVTPNPGLDYFVSVPRLEHDQPLRATACAWRAGGKGINVARMLSVLGTGSRAVALLGGAMGDELARLAIAEGIDLVPVPASAPTRVNVVVEEDTGARIKANAPGGAAGDAELRALAAALAGEASSTRVLALCGSLPPGMAIDALARLAAPALARGVLVAVDAEGEALSRAIDARPSLVKVNASELHGLARCGAESAADVLRGARSLLARGVGMACITRGGAGALLVTRDGAWCAEAPARSATRPVGAGDAFLAGLLASLARGDAPADALRLAVASGTAWALAWPARRPTPEETWDLARAVQPAPL